MLQNKQSHRHSLCSVMSQTNNRVKKFYIRRYIVNLSDLCNVIKKIPDKISCHISTWSVPHGHNLPILNP